MFRFSTFIKDLGSIRKALLFSIFIFAVGIVAGWISTGTIEQWVQQQLEGLRQVSGSLQQSEHPMWSFFVFIFLNNSIKGVLIIYLGLFLGVLPLLFLLMNGMVIGFLLHSSSAAGEDLFTLIVKGLLPHGIIEIPAILISCAFGMQLGLTVIQSFSKNGAQKRERQHRGWRGLFRKTVTASFWTIILLLIAAVIESTLTYTLMKG